MILKVSIVCGETYEFFYQFDFHLCLSDFKKSFSLFNLIFLLFPFYLLVIFCFRSFYLNCEI